MTNYIKVVVVVLRNDEGKFFLQRRVDPEMPEADGRWEFPGGKIDQGESPQEALKRECREEIGCEIEIIKSDILKQQKDWKTKEGATLSFDISFFEGKIVEGTPQPLDRKVSAVGWFTKEEISHLKTLDMSVLSLM